MDRVARYAEFGRRLRLVMAERRMKAPALAGAILHATQNEVTPQAIRKWTAGEAFPGPRNLKALAAVFDKPIEYFADTPAESTTVSPERFALASALAEDSDEDEEEVVWPPMGLRMFEDNGRVLMMPKTSHPPSAIEGQAQFLRDRRAPPKLIDRGWYRKTVEMTIGAELANPFFASGRARFLQQPFAIGPYGPMRPDFAIATPDGWAAVIEVVTFFSPRVFGSYVTNFLALSAQIEDAKTEDAKTASVPLVTEDCGVFGVIVLARELEGDHSPWQAEDQIYDRVLLPMLKSRRLRAAAIVSIGPTGKIEDAGEGRLPWSDFRDQINRMA